MRITCNFLQTKKINAREYCKKLRKNEEIAINSKYKEIEGINSLAVIFL